MGRPLWGAAAEAKAVSRPRPAPSFRPVISEATVRRAQENENKMVELIDQILALPCPLCGRRSLVVQDAPPGLYGLAVFCERVLCEWKPTSHPKIT
jgi:hypothetical protein